MLRKFRQWVTGRAPASPRPPAAPSSSGATRPALVAPQDVSDAVFAEQVLAADRLAVVDFWAEWCAPCTIMSAHVMLLAQEFGEQLLVAALDVDENPNTPARYQVMGLPTLIFFRDGGEVDRQVGILPYEELQRRVVDLLGNPPL